MVGLVVVPLGQVAGGRDGHVAARIAAAGQAPGRVVGHRRLMPERARHLGQVAARVVVVGRRLQARVLDALEEADVRGRRRRGGGRRPVLEGRDAVLAVGDRL